MTDYENEETQGFKVSDKRRFSAEGTSDQPQGPEKQQEAPKDEPRKKERGPKAPVEFSTLITSLAQTAVFQLGLVRSPEMKEPIEPDLVGASQTIDLISLLESKTRGNLTDQEKKLIDDTLFQLRMAFVELSK
ncbi:MAG: DUF1844 domain-containing protein [Deltaproteobacteria bacterium]|nr:DUF1844 domain-containing protein [Deltaproteobacteria bacterium]